MLDETIVLTSVRGSKVSTVVDTAKELSSSSLGSSTHRDEITPPTATLGGPESSFNTPTPVPPPGEISIPFPPVIEISVPVPPPGDGTAPDPPPTNIPTPAPVFTIGPGDTPSRGPSSDPTCLSSPFSESCKTSTVTQITYFVSYGTIEDGNTIVTATTSIHSSESSGCEISAATSTSLTTGAYPYLCSASRCTSCDSQDSKEVARPSRAAAKRADPGADGNSTYGFFLDKAKAESQSSFSLEAAGNHFGTKNAIPTIASDWDVEPHSHLSTSSTKTSLGYDEHGSTENIVTFSKGSGFEPFGKVLNVTRQRHLKRGIPKLKAEPGSHWNSLEKGALLERTMIVKPEFNEAPRIPKGWSSSRFGKFEDAEFNVMVVGLRGCTSVVVVSRQGVWASHFWKGPGFNTLENFKTDILDYMKDGRKDEISTIPLADAVKEAFEDTQHTKIFIMTPATTEHDYPVKATEVDMISSFAQGDYKTLWGPTGDAAWPNRLTPLENDLAQMMPDVPIVYFAYRRQTTTDLEGGWGRAAILYSNNQDLDEQGNRLPNIPPKATWECWMQGKRMGSDIWDATPEYVPLLLIIKS